jgi:putative salt-induced outer membrane protein YdiY
MHQASLVRLAAASIVLCFALTGVLLAQDEKELGPADQAEVSYVSVGGNAKSSSFSLRNTFTYTWQEALFKLEAGALRAETSSFDRRGRLLGDGTVEVIDNEDSELTAESYFLRGRYEASINPALYWFAGAGWEKNEFAGIDSRYGAVGGLGRIWSATDSFKLKTDLGLTYTQEKAVAAAGDADFLGLRFGYDLTRVITPSTTWTSVLFVDGNFDDTGDLRADFTNGLAVAMTERLALKATLQLLYDHEPSFVLVPVDLPPGTTEPQVFASQLDELDSIFAVALVVTF